MVGKSVEFQINVKGQYQNFLGIIMDKASWLDYRNVSVPSGQGGTMEVTQPVTIEGYLVKIPKSFAEKTYTPEKLLILVPYEDLINTL